MIAQILVAIIDEFCTVSFGIIKDHGGEISVQSVPGEGAIFRIVLPVLEEDTVPSSETAPAPRRAAEDKPQTISR